MDKKLYVRNLIADVIASIEKHGGKNCLSSIILTGSFGRGEPTFTVGSDGKVQLKSDVEIALVFPKLFCKNTVTRLIQAVSVEFEEELNLMPVSEKRVRKAYNFNFSFHTPKYKTIFTYDLFNGSRTIWGKDFVCKKNITLADVDLYEAKRLIANRIGELIYLQNIENFADQNYFRQQWKGKLVLAIVSAWLLCEGEYVASYHGQHQKLHRRASEIEGVLGKGFLGEYDKIFNFLREDGSAYEIPDEQLFDYVRCIDRYISQKNIRTPRINSSSRVMKYLIKYAKTGMKYGIIGFENNILQALISDYGSQSKRLAADADVWYRVLY